MNKRWIVIIITALLVFTLAACAQGDLPEPPAEEAQQDTEVEEAADMEQEDDTDTDDADAGQDDDADADQEEEAETIDAAALYAARCSGCHGPNREGNNGPSLLPSRLTKDPAAYVATITDGSGPMPSFGGRLSAEEIDALVEFILSDPN